MYPRAMAQQESLVDKSCSDHYHDSKKESGKFYVNEFDNGRA